MTEGFVKRVLFWLGLALPLASLLASTAPALAAFPGENGRIAFERDLPGEEREVFSMSPDGTGLTDLTNESATDDGNPHWRPDGRQLAFWRFGAVPGRAWLMNPDGSGVTRLNLAGPEAYVDTWSPDGQQVGYHLIIPDGFLDCPSEIFKANSDGTGQVQLTNGNGQFVNTGPSWSPDGQKIAFARGGWDDEGGCDFGSVLYVMNADGSGETNIGAGLGIAEQHSPDWSPDGTKIVFEAEAGPPTLSDIYVVNADGSGLSQLTFTTGGGEYDPVWSPDGTKIAFASTRDATDFEIYVMNADGSGQTRLTNHSGFDSRPSWQPLPHQSTAPYDHPRLAAPVRMALVPNFRQTISSTQCTARGGANSTHGPPLAFASCNPPGFVPGTIAHMGTGSSSWASYATIYGDTNAVNGDQANLTLRASLNDIRTAGLTDYTANITLITKLRITDRFNGGSQTDPATVIDFDYQTAVACGATAGPEGAICNLDSSMDAVAPDTVRETKSTVMQVFRFRVNDSGANGTRGDGDDRTFATQGIYIP